MKCQKISKKNQQRYSTLLRKNVVLECQELTQNWPV